MRFGEHVEVKSRDGYENLRPFNDTQIQGISIVTTMVELN